jgi:hypothetical protein
MNSGSHSSAGCERANVVYSGRKITASLGNVTVRGGKRWKGQGGSTTAKSLSMYNITENIYYSQLSSVAILLQLERNCFTSYSTRKWLSSVFLCAIALRSSPSSHVSTCNGQRSSQLFCVHYTSSGCERAYHTCIKNHTTRLRSSVCE